MSYTSWHVGMKVVFVGFPEKFDRYSHPALVAGRVYTITALSMVEEGDHLMASDGEIVEAASDALYIKVGVDMWFLAHGFRPVQTRKTDISVFTALLNDQKQEEPA
jgi:hypothetical protein